MVSAIIGLAAAFLMATADAGTSPDALTLKPEQRLLFLDDYAVEESTGLARTMHSPEKRGAVIKPDTPSDGPLIQTRGEPVWSPEEQEYKLIYYAYGNLPSGTGMAIATSKDGLTWTKPRLGIVEVKGSKENNWIDIDPKIVAPNRAIDGLVYDAGDPDLSRRYKTMMGAINRRPAVSPDAIHWTLGGSAEVSSSDESHFLYDQDSRRFYAIVKTSNQYGRAFAISESSDFEHWTPNRALFGADEIDQKMAPEIIRRRITDPDKPGLTFIEPEPGTGSPPPQDGPRQPVWRAEVYNIAVFPYEGVYIGLPSMYYPTGTCLPERNNTDGFHEIQLAMSRDLEHWTRLGERRPFIAPSGIEKGRIGIYDRVQLLAANRPLVREKELWFYYSGLKWRDAFYEKNSDGSPRDPATLSPEERADFDDGWGAICLAVLRRDGFISLDADGEGNLITKPLYWEGGKLRLNLSSPKGEAAVEILGNDGQPIPGFTRADSIPVTGDDVGLPVSWKDHETLPDTAGRPLRLKIYLTSARLYALWVE